MVIVRRDLIGNALAICPSAFDYMNVAAEHSRFNTPPTYAIYIAGLVFKWIKAQGGLAAVEAACAEAIAHGVHSADVVLNILAPPA